MDPIEGILRLLGALVSATQQDGKAVDAVRAELCREQMCLGTPHDIARLYRHGYGCVLRPGLVLVRGAAGQRTRKLRMVQLMATEEGCVMYQGGRCLLREVGMTPTQGCLHLLTGGRTDPEVQARTIVEIIAAWSAPENREAVEFCLRALESNQDEISRHKS